VTSLPASSNQVQMEDLLELVVQEGASDLHLTVGSPPVLRIHGSLHRLDSAVLRPEDTERLMRAISSSEHVQGVREKGGVDFGFGFRDIARFRVSIYKQKGFFGMALRLIPSRMLTLKEIGLPNVVSELLCRSRGLILVTGPTGSGKTTTLASMLNVINETRDSHIITVEDPIEYYHDHKKGIVTQREIGADVTGFQEALRRALRQDPDVIMVGEMRDLETMEAAITAAETGHLVFATLHTTGAARTVDRIVDSFSAEQQNQIRTQLASNLVAVISQILLPRCDRPGRIAAFELMVSTPSIQALIRDHKTFRITSDIQTGSRLGMFTLDSHLFDLYNRGMIRREDVLSKAQDVDAVLHHLAEFSAATVRK